MISVIHITFTITITCQLKMAITITISITSTSKSVIDYIQLQLPMSGRDVKKYFTMSKMKLSCQKVLKVRHDVKKNVFTSKGLSQLQFQLLVVQKV